MENVPDRYAGMHWDITIKPEENPLHIRLAEIWQHRFLVWVLVKRDFKAYYKQTAIGPLWHLVQPALTVFVYVIVFNKIGGITTGKVPPVLFYLSGIILWNYFSTCLIASSHTFLSNVFIFSKVYFPRLIMPLSSALSSFIKFAIQFLLLVLVIVVAGIRSGTLYFSFSWLLVVPIVLFTGLLATSLGLIVASLSVHYRDAVLLVTHATSLLIFTAPIVYPLAGVKSSFIATLVQFNPLTPLVEAFRWVLFGDGTVPGMNLLYSVVAMTVILFTGLVLFKKSERNFTDIV